MNHRASALFALPARFAKLSLAGSLWLAPGSLLLAAPWGEAGIRPFAPVPDAVTVPLARAIDEAEPHLDTARAGAALLEGLGLELSPAQRATLQRDRFLLVPIESLPLLDTMEREPMDLSEVDPEMRHLFPEPTGGLAVYADEMLSLYAHLAGWGEVEPWRNHFVTADAMLHAWHRFFGNAMEEIETGILHAKLDGFLDAWLASIRAQSLAAPPALKPHWEQIEAQIAVASILLGDDGEEPRLDEAAGEWDDEGRPIRLETRSIEARAAALAQTLPEAWRAQARDEIQLVLGKEGISHSPLFANYGFDRAQDYTQFTPRSHYTKNQFLRGYFRAMMYLGRNGWPLQEPDESGAAPGLTHALLLAHSLSAPGPDGSSPLEAWREIMELTSFFAGASDDLDYPELRTWLAGQIELASWSPERAVDPETLRQLGANLEGLRRPGILSQVRARAVPGEVGEEVRDESLQFRIFGQRFSHDAWVLTELTPPLMAEMPATPTALYLAAALGDPYAREFALRWLESTAPDARPAFEQKIEVLSRTLAAVPERDWFASMASKQLHLIGTLAGPRETGYPAFMRGPKWGAKQLETMLGSYTQLKHDTLLYAKQSYAEMGEGGLGDQISEDEVPYGFVQPDLRFWAELERLVTYAYEGFRDHGLLPNVVEDWGHLARFREDVSALRLLANKSAANQSWTLEDRLWLLEFNPVYMSEPVNPINVLGPDDGKTAIVADIHTNVRENEILYQGLGRARLLLALVGNDGVNRLVAGTAYDYYEFTLPIQERLGDEAWRQRFYTETPEPQSKPFWTPEAHR